MTPEEKNLQRNLQLWRDVGPKESVFLPYAEDSTLKLIKTAEGEPNLQRNSIFYHSPEGALKESERSFAQLSLDNIDVLFIYGVGLGYDYDAAKDWLKQRKNRKLIFLEDDLAIVKRFFETERARKILSDYQVELHFFDNRDIEKDDALSEIYWHHLSTKIVIKALPSYELHKKELYDSLKHKIFYDTALRDAILEEYLHYGLGFYRNFYRNLYALEGAYNGYKLYGHFKNIPAIICGAGPSLPKQLETLKDLKNNALIFAGGSAMNALNAAGIVPHFGAGVDPNPEQYKRLLGSGDNRCPYFYRNRMDFNALNLVRGPRIYIAGSGGYDVADWFEEQLGIREKEQEELEEGYNVVNFCFSIAQALGCNPIITIGLDLAFTDMSSYAAGVLKDARIAKDTILQEEELDARGVVRPDIFGKPTYTLWKWIAESKWISEFTQAHPETTFINATEGGIGVESVANTAFKEVVEKLLRERFSIDKKIEEGLQQAKMPQVTYKSIQEALDLLAASLQRSINYLDLIIAETEQMIHSIKTSKQEPASTESAQAVMNELALSEEPAYVAVLEIFMIAYSRVLNHQLHVIQHSRSPAWSKAVRRLELNLQRYHFLKNAAQANLLVLGAACK